MTGTPPLNPSQPVWTPPAELVERAAMTQLRRDVGVADYDALWRWSVDDVERFWRTIWDRYGVLADGDPTTVLVSHDMPGAGWFPDVALSFPEHVFRAKDPDALAVQHASELRPLAAWTWRELADRTARIRTGLRAMGIRRGDRVVGYLPNIPETLAAFLAVASLGAVWSCCSPDFGTRTVVDRFAQIEPTVLLTVDGYRYGGKDFARSEVVTQLQAALPTLRHTVWLRYLGSDSAAARSGLVGEEWDVAFPPTEEQLTFERVPFDHPLWIVYSSGTTGAPKAIVHGHGGPLLEQLKTWGLHHDLRDGDRVLWFTSTGWIMWNYLVGALLQPASIVLYDGNPGHPDLGVLWDLVERAGVDFFGTGAAYLHACMKDDAHPREGRELARLRAIGSTGSPLAPDAYRWVHDRVGTHIWLSSASGGTDIAGAFVGGSPLVPVYVGELQARLLGVAVQAWDEAGRPVVDEVGELVVTEPMPSMPVRFWNDPGDERYRGSYFSMYPGVWRHGDWIRITPRGSAVIYGRSDSTINRAGIRMGTAEIYAAVLAVPEVVDALVVDVPPQHGTAESWMGLFVKLADGVGLSDELATELQQRIRRDCSPRHVPDEVIEVPEVPRTLTGKALEVPVKRLLMGRDAQAVVNQDAVANPAALEWFVRFAREQAANRRAIVE
ncbi:MAG: Acetoacetate--CoA ligase [Streptosporangiaceae bacterium]|nr:Acetoacetate--CoA ligase [Streptosporangiaceae bacterium]